MLLASHDMAEVEKLCDRIAIIKDGKVGFTGSPEELISASRDMAEIALKTAETIMVPELSCSKYVKRENGYDYYNSETISEALLELLQTYKDNRYPILDIKIKHSTLEEKFMEFSREELV